MFGCRVYSKNCEIKDLFFVLPYLLDEITKLMTKCNLLLQQSLSNGTSGNLVRSHDKYNGILTLFNQERVRHLEMLFRVQLCSDDDNHFYYTDHDDKCIGIPRF